MYLQCTHSRLLALAYFASPDDTIISTITYLRDDQRSLLDGIFQILRIGACCSIQPCVVYTIPSRGLSPAQRTPHHERSLELCRMPADVSKENIQVVKGSKFNNKEGFCGGYGSRCYATIVWSLRLVIPC
jgi:hypothetical protein